VSSNGRLADILNIKVIQTIKSTRVPERIAVEITIKNYRCFPDSSPIRLRLGNGFIAFIGVNNTGKSSLVRFFYEFRNLFLLLTNVGAWGQAATGSELNFNMFLSTFDTHEVFCNENNRNLQISLSLEDGEIAEFRGIPTLRDVTLNVIRPTPSARMTLSVGPIPRDLSRVRIQGTRLTDISGATISELAPMVEVFKDLSRTLYIGPFRNAINVGTNENYFDMSTGQAFVAKWQSIKTGNSKAQSQSIYEITETIRRIFHFDKLDINASSDGKTLQIYVDGSVYKLQELGSGLAQFLLVLLNAALAKPAYILIDEPEASLHPSLQLEFLTAMGALADRGVLFTTHSLGLARSSADYIYSVTRKSNRYSSVHPFDSTPQLSELMGELSFSGYRELGFKKIILVEGPKDVKTVQQFLRFLKKDGLAVPIPLGGGSLINPGAGHQLEELKRITVDIVALIDSERLTAGEALSRDRQGFLDACKQAKIPCCVLERRAIENYLSDHAIKKVKGEKYNALTPFQKLNELSPSWSKEENWRIAREMSISELEGTDLGKFLSSI
jgi:predicted ATPase